MGLFCLTAINFLVVLLHFFQSLIYQLSTNQVYWNFLKSKTYHILFVLLNRIVLIQKMSVFVSVPEGTWSVFLKELQLGLLFSHLKFANILMALNQTSVHWCFVQQELASRRLFIVLLALFACLGLVLWRIDMLFVFINFVGVPALQFDLVIIR